VAVNDAGGGGRRAAGGARAAGGTARRGRYHHGDVRAALVDAAIGLIAEHGPHGFSLAEASRRIGVSAAAPYRHFADREELLAAVAVRGLTVFAAMAAAEANAAPTPERRLAALAGAYVRFAAEHRPLFETLFSAGVDKSRYPELQRAWQPVDGMLAEVLQLCDGDDVAAEALTAAAEATAHGHAMLLLDGEYGAGPEAVGAAADSATKATLALIAGRAALR
jgi:AcrR family transcriptional regulator